MKAKHTIWWCEHCHASGELDLHGVDVYSAVYKLREAHEQHALTKLTFCEFGIGNVRVQEVER